MKHGILWLPTEIAAFPSEFVFPAASCFAGIRLSLFISLCIAPRAITQQTVRIMSPFSVPSVLVALLFPVSLLQLCPLSHSPPLVQAPHPLLAAMKDNQNLKSSTVEHVSGRYGTVVFLRSSRWLLLLADCRQGRLADALMCYCVFLQGIWLHIWGCKTLWVPFSVHSTHILRHIISSWHNSAVHFHRTNGAGPYILLPAVWWPLTLPSWPQLTPLFA